LLPNLQTARIENSTPHGTDAVADTAFSEASLRLTHQELLADRLRALGEVAAGVAHELNQPLTGVRAFAEELLFAREQGLAVNRGDLFEALERILAQADRMTSIIDHMRGFTRPDEESTAACQLDSVVDHVLGLIGTQLSAHGVTVEREKDKQIPAVDARPRQLEQVVLNLVTNARDALDERSERLRMGRVTRHGHWQPRLRVRVGAEGGSAVLTVEDNAGGVDPAEHIFTPFFTTKKAGQGTGLGLPISRRIVEAHGGRIDLDNDPGRGATFRVVLPPLAVDRGAWIR
jgi:C4-dicarboxylate-specific signal transduction histidine kinase